ncbi:MAG: curli assembly protein CsgF [Pseudomonadales bacterium]|nr:curli assembly protein CsgF [Pseudomonadales bacterium]
MKTQTWLLFLLLISTSVTASELIYTPVNPSFGGNALNGTYLLNSANAQNDLKDPDIEEEEEESDLDDFNDSLQRSLLSRLTSTLTGSMVDDEGNLVPGVLETSDFTIEIVDIGDGEIRVTTTEKATGDSTTFIVNSI